MHDQRVFHFEQAQDLRELADQPAIEYANELMRRVRGVDQRAENIEHGALLAFCQLAPHGCDGLERGMIMLRKQERHTRCLQATSRHPG